MKRPMPRKPTTTLHAVDLEQLQHVQGGFFGAVIEAVKTAIKKDEQPYLEVKLENTLVTSY